jgi:cell division protein FtsI (penicillin-binding protein 3)
MSDFAYTHEKRSRKRTVILTLFFFLWFIGLTLRLIQLQVIDHAQFRLAVTNQNQSKQDIYPERGEILDRRGKVLARSLPAPTVVLFLGVNEPAPDAYAKVLRLNGVLNLSERELQKIKNQIDHQDGFIYIKRKISQAAADQISRLHIEGIGFKEENKRCYPLGTLAAHILGGVGVDNKGLSGLELQYDARLRGSEGQSIMLRDAKKRPYHWEIIKEPVPGEDLILTIDETIQYIAASELEKAVRDNNAAWGTVIVSHPASGEILAMASAPAYDPNDYPPVPLEIGRNQAIQQNFEPGSTFKIVTASAAREFGSVGYNDLFDCSRGSIQVAGWTISDHKRMGVLTFADVIIHSSNVGTIQVGQRIGASNLYRMIKAFHFGEKTGIDLPGEENGICHPLQKWSKVSLAAHSIGYEISVTAIQVLQAMNVIANHGRLVPPRITRAARDASGLAPAVPADAERVISEQTAASLIDNIFDGVVLKGTGTSAQVDGFTVAGKTGTAQRVDPSTRGYSSRQHLASFVGFVPAAAPTLSIIVVIDDPKTKGYYGGTVAAPVFREIARRVLLYLRQLPEFDPSKRVLTARAGSVD